MARRKALVVGGLLFLVMTYLLTSYVWFIQIRGYEDVDPGEILAAANRAGLTRGIRKDDLDQEAVTKHLLQEIPRLAWASLLVRGTMVTIEVAEKAVVDVSLQESGDMVASDGGIVLDVIPIKGSPQVASGDTVMKGQVLISGRLAPYEPEYWALDQAGRTPYLRADGIVNARVWYKETGLIPMVVEVREPTGNSERLTQLIIGSFVLGKATPSFEEYEVAVKSEYLQIRGWNLPLGRQEQVFNEIRVNRYELDYEDAKRIAKEKALKRLPEFEEGNLQNVSYELITQDGVEYMEATVVVEVRKNIAEFAAISAE